MCLQSCENLQLREYLCVPPTCLAWLKPASWAWAQPCSAQNFWCLHSPWLLSCSLLGMFIRWIQNPSLAPFGREFQKRHGQQNDLKKKKSLKTPQLWTRKLGGDSGHFGEGKGVGREKGKEDIYYNRWRSQGSLTRAFDRYWWEQRIVWDEFKTVRQDRK